MRRLEEEDVKFKVGERVGVLWDKTGYLYSSYFNVGVIKGKRINGGWEVGEFNSTDPSYSLRFDEEELEKISSKKTLKTKKGGIMSLLKKLLKPADVLIEKYAMDSSGNLMMSNVLVQEALLNTDDFKKKLVELCKEKEREEKEK